MSRSWLRWVRDRIPRNLKLAVWRLYALVEPHGRQAFSLEGEDQLLLRLLDGRQDGFYVDVGAHHPARYSNTCLFHHMGWRGINIDPDPGAIRLFASARPTDINLCLGISDQPGTLTYYAFNDPALNTFDPALARERESVSGYRLVHTSEVQVERLDTVLSRHLVPGQQIDFLSVDAEGFDFKVLASNDWSRFRPRCVLVEALGASLATVRADPVHEILSSAGYELYAKTINTLLFRDTRSRWN